MFVQLYMHTSAVVYGSQNNNLKGGMNIVFPH